MASKVTLFAAICSPYLYISTDNHQLARYGNSDDMRIGGFAESGLQGRRNEYDRFSRFGEPLGEGCSKPPGSRIPNFRNETGRLINLNPFGRISEGRAKSYFITS